MKRRTESLGGVKISKVEKAKAKYNWRKERDRKETFSAWVRRKLGLP